MSWIVWDLLALLIISLLVWNCARRGFLSKIVGFVGAIVSAVGAAWLSAPAAVWLYDSIVRDAIRAVLSRQVATSLEEGLSSAGGLLAAVPGWASRMAEGTDLPMPEGTEQITAAVEGLIDAALAQPVLLLLRGLCFFALFALFSLLIRYLARMFGGINSLPLIGSVNTALGGVLGVGEALIALYLLAVLARLYIAYSGGGAGILSARTMQEGFLFSFFYRLAG